MKELSPVHYDLRFEPDLDKATFSGSERIEVVINKPSGRVVMNAAELEITGCFLTHKGKRVEAKTKTDARKEELEIRLPKKIRGKAVINIDFKGILNNRLLGFYRSTYKEKGKTKYLATTQFEPTDARRAFPCWDDPAAKATFGVTLVTERKHAAISNMPLLLKKTAKGKIIHRFAKTPRMSTYLLYLGVGEFEFLSRKTGRRTIRVITTKGNRQRGRFALDSTRKFLEEYEKYFGIKYPLPKLDLIAIPDFAAGAMENWGAITFRERLLLFDPKKSSARTKQNIALVIAHELAHMWFGDLVTMATWEDLWLNESFATYMATKIVDRLHPEWELWDQFLDESMTEAMSLDSLKSSHPIHVKIDKPSKVGEIFDAISYEKGGCILRMIDNYIGEKAFVKGLSSYLRKHSYGNAAGKDLWDSLGKASEKPVAGIVSKWINQIGFPVVEATMKEPNLILDQKRYLAEPGSSPGKATWPIPVLFSSDLKPVLMTKRTAKVRPGKTVVINSGRTGFFRVKYPREILQQLGPEIGSRKIGHVDRWGIENDLFSLCVSGHESIINYLEFTRHYLNEENYLASSSVALDLYSVYLRAFGEEFAEVIRRHAETYFRGIFSRLGWEGKKREKHTDTLLRPFSISVLGKLGDQAIIREASRRFMKFLRNPASLKPDIAGAVFSLMAWTGDGKTYEKLLSLYRKAKTQEESQRFLDSLCAFKDPELLKRTLDFSLTDEVRSQDILLPVAVIAGNPYGKSLIWPWVRSNWDRLVKKVGQGNPLLRRVVAALACTEAPMEEEIRHFFKKNPAPGTEMVLEQTMEKVRIRTKFLERMREDFRDL